MNKNFSWNPVEDQIFDGEYDSQILMHEDAVDGYSIYTFNKVNSNFTISTNQINYNNRLSLSVNENSNNIKNHIYWKSDVYGKTINVVNGRLWCTGTKNNRQKNAIIDSEYQNYLSMNIASMFLMTGYDNILFQTVNFNIMHNALIAINNNNNVIFSGYSSDINIDDNSSFRIYYNNKIHIEDVNFLINITGDSNTGFELGAGIIEFFSYDGSGARGIALNNISYGHIHATQISLNDAKVFINNNSYLDFNVDKLIVASGGRFTLGDAGQMNLTGFTNSLSQWSSSDLASYPKGLFYFNAPSGAIDGFFTMESWSTGKELSDLLAYGLISVNGNTDEGYLRNVLNFENLNSFGTNTLKISMKK